MRQRSPFQIQKAVVFALFVREMRTRYGKYRMGYVWALVEPMLQVVVLAAIWTALGRETLGGAPVAMFLITGIIPFLFFQKTATQAMNAVQANSGLFNYRQVRPIDPVIARIGLETLIYIVVYCVLLFIGGWFLSYDVKVYDPLLLILVSGTLWLLTFGISLLMSIYGTLYPEAMKLVPGVLFRPLYFMSGMLFPLFVIPSDYHHWLLWNPLLHVIELSHVAWFRGFPSPDANLAYPAMWGLTATALGLLSYRANWMRMVTT